MRDPVELEIESKAPPARDEDFDRFALQFGVCIPEELRRILKRFNGGCLGLNTFLPRGRDEDDVVDIVELYHLGRGGDEGLSLGRAMASCRTVLPKGALPFAYSSCGDELVVDTLRSPHAVYFCDHEDGHRCSEIEGSFGGFIDGLRRP